MKDALKISLFFIQLICLLLKKSYSGVIVENLFRNWFVFHLNGLFDLFQLLGSAVTFIQKLVHYLSYWFVCKFIISMCIAYILRVVCFSSDWFVYVFPILASIALVQIKTLFVFHPFVCLIFNVWFLSLFWCLLNKQICLLGTPHFGICILYHFRKNKKCEH